MRPLNARHRQVQLAQEFLVCAFGAFFCWTAVHKALWPDEAVRFASIFVASPPTSDLVIKGVTLIELAAGSALLLNVRPRQVLVFLLLLLVVFSTALVYARSTGYVGTCGCAGLGKTLDHALIRNAVLAVAACVTTWLLSVQCTTKGVPT